MNAFTRYCINAAGEAYESERGEWVGYEDAAALAAECEALKKRCEQLESASNTNLTPVAWESRVTPQNIAPFTKLHKDQAEIKDFVAHYEGRGCTVETYALVRINNAQDALQSVCTEVLNAERDARHLLSEKVEQRDDVLRSLACWLGAGGYNADEVDPVVFEQKIRDGVDMLVRNAAGRPTASVPAGHVPVSEDALRKVLEALNGAPYRIGELQVTRSPASLFPDNPINILIAQYNAHASGEAAAARTT